MEALRNENAGLRAVLQQALRNENFILLNSPTIQNITITIRGRVTATAEANYCRPENARLRAILQLIVSSTNLWNSLSDVQLTPAVNLQLQIPAQVVVTTSQEEQIQSVSFSSTESHHLSNDEPMDTS